MRRQTPAADIAEAAENAGVNSASRSVPETAVQGTSDIAAGGSVSGETAPQTAAEEDTPSVFSLPEADSSTAAQSSGISGRAISDGDSAGIVPAEDTGALTLPEAVRGLRIAHCYIASCPSLTANCCIQTAARHGSSSTTTCLRFRTR